MRDRKLFVGAGIRRMRESRGMTQADLASRLKISTAYLSQMETNQRPVSASALYGLTQLFGADATNLISEDPERLAADLREALADPMFPQNELKAVDVRALVTTAPWLAHRFITMHGAYRRSLERSGGNDVDPADVARTPTAPIPFEEVRDFFHYTDNYLDAVDRAAEQLSYRIADTYGRDRSALISYLKERHDVRVNELHDGDPRRHAFDKSSRILGLNPGLEAPTRDYQIALTIGCLEFSQLVNQFVENAGFRTDDARSVARVAVANYFAAALLMPYERFIAAARETRHDLARLRRQFGASFEQVCHRLSTLQRPGNKGVPVYFVKVDQAGNIVKRHSATRFQFARFGGACPLWNVHEAFETPDRILIQQAEMPDGAAYLCLAMSVVKPATHFGGASQRYAIGLGCSLAYADNFVYGDAIDVRGRIGIAKIGVSCRLCPRVDCVQRSQPPLSGRISFDSAERGALPYSVHIE